MHAAQSFHLERYVSASHFGLQDVPLCIRLHPSVSLHGGTLLVRVGLACVLGMHAIRGCGKVDRAGHSGATCMEY